MVLCWRGGAFCLPWCSMCCSEDRIEGDGMWDLWKFLMMYMDSAFLRAEFWLDEGAMFLILRSLEWVTV